MLDGFKKFILRGNVVDMAVGVVIGAAFGGVVTALTTDLLTPLIAAIVGKPDFRRYSSRLMGSRFPLGDFINAVHLVRADRGGGLFLRGHAGERVGGAHASRRGAGRSDDQEVSGVPERDSDRGEALCIARSRLWAGRRSSGATRLAAQRNRRFPSTSLRAGSPLRHRLRSGFGRPVSTGMTSSFLRRAAASADGAFVRSIR